ncbi:hypothetical protein AWH56_001865 [Anaerobacillus isosaccharinicus]|uniref:Uncharacterized protein n=1 Tax=Anaerobacillus isosaccharinicus TaxID=1532552 RepID=A0A1S2L2U8_9BACI|nr:hypothetical protein [Anaerobacillus isosaccharinicus]MBA5585199.1 hypothetical protein [Anaerobacillus isosaccharinicus]QOY36463.1 hypothetical protein AWH56_001865 [Anaerobacillus isosaccharinicus]
MAKKKDEKTANSIATQSFMYFKTEIHHQNENKYFHGITTVLRNKNEILHTTYLNLKMGIILVGFQIRGKKRKHKINRRETKMILNVVRLGDFLQIFLKCNFTKLIYR